MQNGEHKINQWGREEGVVAQSKGFALYVFTGITFFLLTLKL